MKAVITVIGKDSVGILAKVSEACSKADVNIVEVTQSVLQDMFADNSETNQTSIDYQSVENMQIDQYNQPVELLWRDF